jgi:hypothetical protein
MKAKRAEVVADITRVTGMGIIKAILAGERDPQRLAARRNVMCKRSRAEIARALEGVGGRSTCSPRGRPWYCTSSTGRRSRSATSHWPPTSRHSPTGPAADRCRPG